MRTNPVIKYWVITFIGIAVSFSLFFLINSREIQKNHIVVDNAISQTKQKLIDELRKIDLVIESISFYFENTPNVSQETFLHVTNQFKGHLNGIKAFEWAPKIYDYEKANFVTKNNGTISVTIKEADQSNLLINSRKKSIYYPVSLINPTKHDWILGYDLYSESNRKSAIKKSKSSKDLAFTSPIKLINDNNELGFLAIKTVLHPNKLDVKGAVAVVYRMNEFLQKTLNDELNVFNLTIKDQLSENSLLFTNLSDKQKSNKNLSKVTSGIKAADRIWYLSFYPKKEYVKFPNSAESYFVLFLGLTITFLLIVNIKGRDIRSMELEKKVWNRTKELEVSNKQKENLLREIHHRVMNNLQITSSLINLQKRKLQDEEAIYALSCSQDRIKAIALIHQKIYQHNGAEAVDLKNYLENLINNHKQMSPNVNYIIDCPQVFIDLDSAVPLAIITSEIVINALKHAFADNDNDKCNQLYILVTPMKNDVIDIVISDNGQGMPTNTNIGQGSGLGYDIVKKLCRQLQAEYEFSSSSSGTAFSMRFKQRKLRIPSFS